MLTRTTALVRIDAIREPLPVKQYNDLAGVVRALYDGYPLEDAQGSLDAASYSLPIEITRQVRAVLNDTKDWN